MQEIGMNDDMGSDSPAHDDAKREIQQGMERIHRLEAVQEYESALKEAQAVRAYILKQREHGRRDLYDLSNALQHIVKHLEVEVSVSRRARPGKLRQFIATVTHPFLWPLPALLIHAIVLIFSKTIWQTTEMMSRSSFYKGIPAHEDMLMVVIMTGVFYGSFLDFFEDLLAGWGMMQIGMSTPTGGEKGCAVWLVRVGAIVGLYVTALGSYASFM
jgi:hypothetical protein